ncbi:MAG: WecB/TagA/CpsF family glycosyltransferase [Kiritimatiellia bacterium]
MAQVAYDGLLAEMEVWRQSRGESRFVCFCDANGLAHGWRDGELAAAYRKADAVVADGVIMLEMARIYGGRLPGRVIGPVFFEKAMEYGVGRGWRHAFCGANEETLAKLKANMEDRFPGVRIVGAHAPGYSADPAVPQGMECDFLWVALGSPKQEKWCARHLGEFSAKAVLPVGAAFDFHAGTQRPVPQWVHRCGVCWLWRMFTGGSRVLKRDLWCVPRAAWILVRELVVVGVFRRGIGK